MLMDEKIVSAIIGAVTTAIFSGVGALIQHGKNKQKFEKDSIAEMKGYIRGRWGNGHAGE